MEFLNLHKVRSYPVMGVFITFILITLFYSLLQIPLVLELNARGIVDLDAFFNESYIDLNYALILFSLGFAGITLGLLTSLNLIHNDRFIRLITTTNKVDYKRIVFGLVIWGLLLLVTFMMDYFFVTGPSEILYNGISKDFFIAILVSFVFLFIQTSAEEFMCRGYLMQALGYVFKRRWIPIVISGLFFGCLHILNPEIEEYGLEIMLLHYCSVGVFLGIIVVMDNRLELALGFHAVNNILSGLLINFDGAAFKTYALFTTSSVDPYLGYVIWLISAIIFYMWCSKKYKWKSLRYLLVNID